MDYNKVLNFIDSAKQQGYSDADISDFLKQKGIKIEDVQKAYVSKQPKSQEHGFLQSVIQGITSLPARFGATIAAQGADLGSFADAAASGFKTMDFSKGDKIRQEGLDLGYLGKAKPIGGDINNQTFSGLAKDVAGTALQGALDVGTLGAGGAALEAGEGVAKAGIGALAKQGAKEGAVLGAGYGLSNSLQDDTDWAHTALNTILGAATGGVLGGAAGVAVPKISSALSTVKGNVAENGLVKGVDKSFLDTVEGISKKVETDGDKEVVKVTIPKDTKKGLNAAGDILEELEGMKGVNIDPTNVEQRNAVLQTIKDGKFDFNEINYGGEKQVDFTPMVKKLATETKDIAESQDALIRGKYNRSYSKKELENTILSKRQEGVEKFGTENSLKYQKALADEMKNQQLNKMTSATELLAKARSIKFDPTADSATQQARNDVKEAIMDLLKKDFPGFAEKSEQMHRNFLVLDAFGKGLAKPGQSIQEKIAGIAGAFAAAPQGIVASYVTRNAVQKIFKKLFGGTYSLESAKKAFEKEAAPLIEEWTAKGVSKDNIFKLMQERYAYGQPTKETIHDIVMEIQSSADKLAQEGTEQATKKMAEQKSLIRIIKGLGNDVAAIKEELAGQGINVSDTDAKTFAALNKNSGKSITPYIEKLAKLATIKAGVNEVTE